MHSRIIPVALLVALLSGCGLPGSCRKLIGGGPTLDEVGGVRLVYSADLGGRADDEEVALDQALEVVRDRVDNLEVTDANVYPELGRIVVEVVGARPGDVESIRRVVEREGRLEFLIVDDEGSTWIRNLAGTLPADVELRQEEPGLIPHGGTGWYLAAPALETLEAFVSTLELPDGHLLYFQDVIPGGGSFADREWRTWFLVDPEPGTKITGRDVADATAAFDEDSGQPYVAVDLTTGGAETFLKLTTQHEGRRLAIALDGRVIIAPLVREPIAGGKVRITMGENKSTEALMSEVQDLVLLLRSGALPVKLVLESETVVGPAEAD